MRNKIEISLLLDYYGILLTEKQCELLRLSTDEDFSLGEIAEQIGISRQGVRDTLVRGEKLLYEMEAKLGLAARDMRIIEMIKGLRAFIDNSPIADEISSDIDRRLSELLAVVEDKDGI